MGFNQAIQFIKDCSDVAYCIVYVNFAEGFIPPFILLVSKDKKQGGANTPRRNLVGISPRWGERVRSGFYSASALLLYYSQGTFLPVPLQHQHVGTRW